MMYPNRGKWLDNGQWIDGYLYIDTPLYCFTEDASVMPKSCSILCPGFADWGMARPMEKYPVDPNSVGTYIGMKGTTTTGEQVELATGMIVNLSDYHGRRHSVEIKGPAGGGFYYGGDGFSDEYITNASDIQVIGNACEIKE